MEIWKDINGYEGLYQISNIGRLKRLPKMVGRGRQYKVGEKILKPQKTKNGYLRIHLDRDGKREFVTIHRLVANAFIGNPHNLPCVNHKNENKEDNISDNLEWCDAKYNANYGERNKRIAKSKMNHIVTKETRMKIRTSLKKYYENRAR